MKLSLLPMQSSLTSKDVASELKAIQTIAEWHKRQMIFFARDHNMAALLLRDNHCKPSEKNPALFNVHLEKCWYKNRKRFRKGDKILLVNSSNAKTGTVLKLIKHSDPFDWRHLKALSNNHWSCLVEQEVNINARKADK